MSSMNEFAVGMGIFHADGRTNEGWLKSNTKTNNTNRLIKSENQAENKNIMLFSTFSEAALFAKSNPGAVITRNPDSDGFKVKIK